MVVTAALLVEEVAALWLAVKEVLLVVLVADRLMADMVARVV